MSWLRVLAWAGVVLAAVHGWFFFFSPNLLSFAGIALGLGVFVGFSLLERSPER